MKRVLAIEWEQRQARFVLAAVRGQHISVLAADRITLPLPDEGLKGPHPDLAVELRERLQQVGAGRARVLVGLSRAQVDLRQLALPPAPDAQLPELVQHQATRELSTAGDGALLDFVPLGTDETRPRDVLVAALSAEQRQQFDQFCDEAGIRPQRLFLRPFATGSLFTRRQHDDPGVCLLVDVQRDEADLTVLSGGRVCISRCMRLPIEEDDPVPLLAEIRRTLVAVQNQSSLGPVEHVYICGTDRQHEELLERLRNVLDQPVDCFDPLAGVERAEAPAEGGQFAALLGMIADDADPQAETLDFLNPRQPPRPPDRRNLLIAAAAIVVLAGGWFGWFTWSSLGTLDGQLADLTQQSKERDKVVRLARETEAAVAAIEQWRQGDVNWLEELRELSAEFPSQRDAMLQRLVMSRAPAGGGTIELDGLVRDPALIERMETSLRDDYHEVRSRRVQESAQPRAFTWEFESSISVVTRSTEEYVATAKAAAESATTAARQPAVDSARTDSPTPDSIAREVAR